MKSIQKLLNLTPLALVSVALGLGSTLAAATQLTGKPVEDGFTFRGNLWDTGKWVYDGPGQYSNQGLNMAVYTKVFALTADDKVTAEYGDLGNVSNVSLVGIYGGSGTSSSDPNDAWQVGDRILAIGYVPATPVAGGFTFKFNSDGDNTGTTPWQANSAPRNEALTFNGYTDGRSSGTTGTGPGDLRTVQHNQTNSVFRVSEGNVQFKTASNGNSTAIISDPINIEAKRGIISIANSANTTPPLQGQGTNQLESGQLLINLSVIERNDTGDRDASPEKFANVIDFVVSWTAGSAGSEAVFFNISTLLPPPPAPALTAQGFQAPLDRTVVVKKANRVLPLRFKLLDSSGAIISNVVPPVVQVEYFGIDGLGTGELLEVTSVGQGSEGNAFVWNGEYWAFNLSTKGLAKGSYKIYPVSGKLLDYVIDPTCMATVLIE